MSRMDDATMTQGNQGQGAGGQANLGETASQVGENLRNLGSQVRDQATQQYDQLRQQAGDYYEQGRQRAMEYEQSLEQYVHEKPIQSLMIAAGVGMLLGILWKRS
jgi:ElaB/YqjD/DUF883 family membrane-anchored ribosome-binding protein